MPIGNDFPTYWSNLVAGVTGTRLIQGFDASAFEVRIAAEVLDFDPTDGMDAKMARRMTRFIHLGMAAGKEAVADSGIDFAAMTQDERDRVGVVMNTGGGGIEAIIDGTHVHDTKGPRFVSAFAVPALSGSMGAAHALDGVGPDRPGHDPGRRLRDVGHRLPRRAPPDPDRRVRRRPRRRIRGARSCRWASPRWPTWAPCRSATTRPRPRRARSTGPATASSSARAPASSSIESLAHALARGATPLAEVLGGALTADAFHISAPEPTGRGQSRAMTNALRNSGVAPDEIDYIVAHGTSTPLNDVTETRAIKTAYGAHARKVAISSPKSMIGHLVGAAGIAVGAGRRSARSATRSSRRRPTSTRPDPECDLDYVPLTARKARVETVAVHGFGFGGQNAVAIFRRVDGLTPARQPRRERRPSNASIRVDERLAATAIGRSVA